MKRFFAPAVATRRVRLTVVAGDVTVVSGTHMTPNVCQVVDGRIFQVLVALSVDVPKVGVRTLVTPALGRIFTRTTYGTPA